MGFLSSLALKVAPSLIGGLFGGKSKQSSSRINFQQMRDDAAAAGYNPLSALKYTGGAGNTTTTHPPSLSSREFIGQALSDGVTTWFNREQIARDEQVESLKLATMREELKLLKNRNKVPTGTFGYSIPAAVGVGVTASGRTKEKLLPALSTTGQSVVVPASRERPYLETPTTVIRDDGLQAANPDAPVEFETDAWTAARNGELPSFAWELYKRNTMTDKQRANVKKAKGWVKEQWDSWGEPEPKSKRPKGRPSRKTSYSKFNTTLPNKWELKF